MTDIVFATMTEFQNKTNTKTNKANGRVIP